MAAFSKLIITNQGQALIAKMIAGTGNIEFTKVSVSNAVYTEEQLQTLTELSDIKQTSPISKVVRTNDVTVRIEAAITNTKLTEGYYMRALGLYALDGESEILYAVTIETSGNCYMPPYNGITVSGAYVQLVTTVGNAENVTLEVDQAAIATIGDILDLQEQIDNRLPLSGGTMDANSKVTIPGDNGRSTSLASGGIRFKAAAGNGWAQGLTYYSADDATRLCQIGAYGIGSKLEYIYIGGSYNDPIVKIMPDGTLACPNLSGNASTAKSLAATTLTNENLNDIAMTSFDVYQAQQGHTCTNAPVASYPFTLIATRMSSSAKSQIAVYPHNNAMYMRSLAAGAWSDWVIINAADTGWITCTLGSFAASGTIKYRIVGKQIAVHGSQVVLAKEVAISPKAPQSIASCTYDFTNIKNVSGIGRWGSYAGIISLAKYNGNNIIHICGIGSAIPAETSGDFYITGFID